MDDNTRKIELARRVLSPDASATLTRCVRAIADSHGVAFSELQLDLHAATGLTMESLSARWVDEMSPTYARMLPLESLQELVTWMESPTAELVRGLQPRLNELSSEVMERVLAAALEAAPGGGS